MRIGRDGSSHRYFMIPEKDELEFVRSGFADASMELPKLERVKHCLSEFMTLDGPPPVEIVGKPTFEFHEAIQITSHRFTCKKFHKSGAHADWVCCYDIIVPTDCLQGYYKMASD